MGSSARKKKEKKKDFQKAKLKVGKTKPKPANFTDTSFRSKGIVVRDQSLKVSAPTQSELFSQHFRNLSSPSDSQRKESLSFITTAISNKNDAPKPPIPDLLPLILDDSGEVRRQLLKLLTSLPTSDCAFYAEKMLLYIQAGMTHIREGVVNTTMDILGWAIDAFGQELVSRPGGWVKMLKFFLTMLGWTELQEPTTSGGWSTYKGASVASDEKKTTAKKLNTLAAFLRAGLSDPPQNDASAQKWPFPLCQTEAHMIPKIPHAFRSLNLFGRPWDEESAMYQSVDERKGMFVKYAQAGMEKGLEGAKKEGGEIGRAATIALNVISEKMAGYEAEELEEDELPWIIG